MSVPLPGDGGPAAVPRIGAPVAEDTLARFEAWAGGGIERKTRVAYARQVQQLVTKGLPGLRDGELLTAPAVREALRTKLGPRASDLRCAVKKFVAFLDEGEEGDEEYEVEAILGERERGGKMEYKVHWKGYAIADATWEPEEHLKHSAGFLRDFRRSRQLEPLAAQLRGNATEPTLTADRDAHGHCDYVAHVGDDCGTVETAERDHDDTGCDSPSSRMPEAIDEGIVRCSAHVPAAQKAKASRLKRGHKQMSGGHSADHRQTGKAAAVLRCRRTMDDSDDTDDDESDNEEELEAEQYLDFVEEVVGHRDHETLDGEALEYKVRLSRTGRDGAQRAWQRNIKWLPAASLLVSEEISGMVKQYADRRTATSGEGDAAENGIERRNYHGRVPQQLGDCRPVDSPAFWHSNVSVVAAAPQPGEGRAVREAAACCVEGANRAVTEELMDMTEVSSSRAERTTGLQGDEDHDEPHDGSLREGSPAARCSTDSNAQNRSLLANQLLREGPTTGTPFEATGADISRANKSLPAANLQHFISKILTVQRSGGHSEACVRFWRGIVLRHLESEGWSRINSQNGQYFITPGATLHDSQAYDPSMTVDDHVKCKGLPEALQYLQHIGWHASADWERPSHWGGKRKWDDDVADDALVAVAPSTVEGRVPSRSEEGAATAGPTGLAQVVSNTCQADRAVHESDEHACQPDVAQTGAKIESEQQSSILGEILAQSMHLAAKERRRLFDSTTWPLLEAEGWTKETDRCRTTYYYGPRGTKTNCITLMVTRFPSVLDDGKCYRLRGVACVIQYLQATNWHCLAQKINLTELVSAGRKTKQKGAEKRMSMPASSARSSPRLCEPVPLLGKRKRTQTSTFSPELEAAKSQRKPAMMPQNRAKRETISAAVKPKRWKRGDRDGKRRGGVASTKMRQQEAPQTDEENDGELQSLSWRDMRPHTILRGQLETLVWPNLQDKGWTKQYNRHGSVYFQPGATQNNSTMVASNCLSTAFAESKFCTDGLYRFRGFSQVIRYLQATKSERKMMPRELREIVDKASAATGAKRKRISKRDAGHGADSIADGDQSGCRPPQHEHLAECKPTRAVEGKDHGVMTTEAISQPDPSAYHVVIVGAGTAGLSAAKALVAEAGHQLADNERGPERRKLVVTVLEGKDRVGGRIHTVVMGENGSDSNSKCRRSGNDGVIDGENIPRRFPVDLGASFVHGCNQFNPVWQLAQDLGVPLDTSEGGYSEGWGRGAPWLTSGGKRIGFDKIHRIYALYKDITAEVDRIAAEEEVKPTMDDNLQMAVDEAHKQLKKKFRGKVGTLFDAEESKQVLESINVLWAGYCSTLKNASLAMTVDKNWDDIPTPQRVAESMESRVAVTATGLVEDDESDKGGSSSTVRRSVRRRKLPSVATAEEERDESDGLVVCGYGPFLIVRASRE